MICPKKISMLGILHTDQTEDALVCELNGTSDESSRNIFINLSHVITSVVAYIQ
jgi:hypothetical protein